MSSTKSKHMITMKQKDQKDNKSGSGSLTGKPVRIAFDQICKPKVPAAKKVVPRDLIKPMLCHLNALHKECSSKAALTGSPADRSWLSADEKTLKTFYSPFLDAAAGYKRALASVYGDRPVPYILPLSITFTATAGTGVTNTPLTIRASDATEYASLAALFDEFRMTGGELEYFLPLPTSTVVLGTSSLTYDACAAIGYDPSDNTAPSTARAVTELFQHQQQFPRMSMTPTVGTYVGLFGREDNRPYKFGWSTKHVSQVTDSNGNVTDVGMWRGCATTPQSDGFLKVYFQSGASTAVAGYLGTGYYHLEFRSRT